MKVQLLEYKNKEGHSLRGIISFPKGKARRSVICIHGFERCSTTEKKFKVLSEHSAQKMMTVLRLDFTGCGLSDGDFKHTTIKKQADDFIIAFKRLKQETGHKYVNIVAHSLGACILGTKINEIKKDIEKIILIAPALNQKELLKYWFVVSQMKMSHEKKKITWENYLQYFEENAFKKEYERNDKMTKTNYIGRKYFQEAKYFDFSEKFCDFYPKTLYIHGTKDTVVPIESIRAEFTNQIIIENGDHDLEQPKYLEQWKNKAVNFLEK